MQRPDKELRQAPLKLGHPLSDVQWKEKNEMCKEWLQWGGEPAWSHEPRAHPEAGTTVEMGTNKSGTGTWELTRNLGIIKRTLQHKYLTGVGINAIKLSPDCGNVPFILQPEFLSVWTLNIGLFHKALPHLTITQRRYDLFPVFSFVPFFPDLSLHNSLLLPGKPGSHCYHASPCKKLWAECVLRVTACRPGGGSQQHMAGRPRTSASHYKSVWINILIMFWD